MHFQFLSRNLDWFSHHIKFRLVSAQTDERASRPRGGWADRGRHEVLHREGGPAQPQQLLYVSLDAAFVEEELLQISRHILQPLCLRYPSLLLLFSDNPALILPILPKLTSALNCIEFFSGLLNIKPILVSIWIHDNLLPPRRNLRHQHMIIFNKVSNKICVLHHLRYFLLLTLQHKWCLNPSQLTQLLK